MNAPRAPRASRPPRERPRPSAGVRLFVQCGLGLEEALAEELRELGLRARTTRGGCECDGPQASFERLNLWLRTAERVWLVLGFARRPAELSAISVERLLPSGALVEVRGAGVGVGPFEREARRLWGASSVSDAKAFELLVRGDAPRGATVCLDTTGALLHFRGARQEVGRAPLRETLAAGVLRLAGWAPAEPLWDLMCGSGALVIEAAERTAGLAPGRNRAFAFEGFAGHDGAAWRALPRVAGAADGTSGGAGTGGPGKALLRASDLNAGALGTARRNARRAGVEQAIVFERLDATRLEPPQGGSVGPGLVVANLPYGRRVGARSELGALYAALGASVRRACAGWRFAFLLEEGDERLDLAVDRRFEIANGGLHCRLLVGRVPAPALDGGQAAP